MQKEKQAFQRAGQGGSRRQCSFCCRFGAEMVKKPVAIFVFPALKGTKCARKVPLWRIWVVPRLYCNKCVLIKPSQNKTVRGAAFCFVPHTKKKEQKHERTGQIV